MPRGGAGTHQKRDAGRAKDSNDIKAWRPVRVTGQTYPEEEPQEEKKAEDNAATAEGEAQEAAAAAPLEPIWVDHKIVLKGKIFQNVRYDFNKRLSPTYVVPVGRLLTPRCAQTAHRSEAEAAGPEARPQLWQDHRQAPPRHQGTAEPGCGAMVANRR